MKNIKPDKIKKITWPIIIYLLLVLSAMSFDLLTDRSFGAMILSILPIALIIFLLLIVGHSMETERRYFAIRDMMMGAVLILIITTTFSLFGDEQAKTAELIFTYAMLISCMPISFALPFLIEPLGSWLINEPLIRIILTWMICMGLGWTEWKILSWFVALFRRSPQ